ncbi:MAG: thiamine pyrophosphate-dependent enzyme [Methanotrichaceae archaeon]
MTNITGVDALKQAVSDADAKVLLFVPGYPVTEAAQALGEKEKMAVNEKVALEAALGASATGQRSLVLVKHLGMNLLADPLSISPTHTIGSSLVILVGEDLGPSGSQIELDVRNYGSLCELPVIDPSGPEVLHFALMEAYFLSEKISAPVIVRTSFKLDEALDWKRDLKRDLSFRPKTTTIKTFDRSIWNLTAKGRHQKYLRDSLPQMAKASENTSLNFLRKCDDVGIIASGRPAKWASDLDSSLLVLGYAHPLPWKSIKSFIEDHRKILIAEEPLPFIESKLRMSDKVCGKLTGHLPFGKLEAADLKKALDKIDLPAEQKYHIQTVEERGSRTICDDCPYLPLYEAIKNLNVLVAGDAGCSIRAVRPPLDTVDMVYGLGSSIGVASGFAKKGIALIGDYAFVHSGIQGLINAVYQKRDVLVVLLQNRVAAMTGGQDVPDIVPILEAIVPQVRKLDMPAPEERIEKLLKSELARPGVSAMVASGSCPRYS